MTSGWARRTRRRRRRPRERGSRPACRPPRRARAAPRRRALGGAGRVVVVVVESHLAGRDDPRVAEPAAEPGSARRVPVAGVMRMEARGGGEPRVGAGEGERPLGGWPGFADHDHVADAGGPGPLEHRVRGRRRSRVGEVAVGVDQHDRVALPGTTRPSLPPRACRLAGCPTCRLRLPPGARPAWVPWPPHSGPGPPLLDLEQRRRRR